MDMVGHAGDSAEPQAGHKPTDKKPFPIRISIRQASSPRVVKDCSDRFSACECVVVVHSAT